MSDEFDQEDLEHGFDLLREAIEGSLLYLDDDREQCVARLRKDSRSAVANKISILVSGRFGFEKNPNGTVSKWTPSALDLALTQTDMRDGMEAVSPFMDQGFELMDLFDEAVRNTVEQGRDAWLLFNLRLDAFQKLLIDKRWVIHHE